MCAIVGRVNFNKRSVNRSGIKRGLQTITHRGPDAEAGLSFEEGFFSLSSRVVLAYIISTIWIGLLLSGLSKPGTLSLRHPVFFIRFLLLHLKKWEPIRQWRMPSYLLTGLPERLRP